MHEEERAQRVRIVEMEAMLSPATSAEPLPWQVKRRLLTIDTIAHVSLILMQTRTITMGAAVVAG